jgi:hypothetical protein
MKTNPQPAYEPRAPAQARALLDYSTADDCFSEAGLASAKLGAEDQLTRFLQWLQLTDRGAQPC